MPINKDALKAFIFDYDGVLVNSDPFTRYALGKVLLSKGLELTEERYKKYFAGKTLRHGFDMFLKDFGRTDEIEEFIALKQSFDPEYAEHIEVYDDAVELIDRLRGKYRLAIATGSRRVLIDAALRKFGWNGVFDVIICAEDYEKSKPDPGVYLKSLEKLNIVASESIVIEDAPWGIEAAHRAGIECIAVSHTHSELDLTEADLIVKSLSDVK